MRLLGEPGQHPEGLFFPDTYLFGKGTGTSRSCAQARTRMKKRAGSRMGRPRGRPADRDALRGVDTRLDRRKGNRARGRAARASAVYSWSGCGSGCGCRPIRPSSTASARNSTATSAARISSGRPLQYLHARRPAADTDRPARSRGTASCGATRRARRALSSSRPGLATAATSSRRRSASTSTRLPSISAGSGIRTGGVECAADSSPSRAAKASARARRSAARLRGCELPAVEVSSRASPAARRGRSVCASCCSSDPRSRCHRHASCC